MPNKTTPKTSTFAKMTRMYYISVYCTKKKGD